MVWRYFIHDTYLFLFKKTIYGTKKYLLNMAFSFNSSNLNSEEFPYPSRILVSRDFRHVCFKQWTIGKVVRLVCKDCSWYKKWVKQPRTDLPHVETGGDLYMLLIQMYTSLDALIYSWPWTMWPIWRDVALKITQRKRSMT